LAERLHETIHKNLRASSTVTDTEVRVRAVAGIFALCIAFGGCSVSTERSTLGYGDYVGLSCDQLAQEAVRLMRQVVDRSKHLLDDDQNRRETALLQLKAVRQASADKRC
jgi:hypothetical protein